MENEQKVLNLIAITKKKARFRSGNSIMASRRPWSATM